MWWIKVPAGRVFFVGGWRRWTPMLVVWFVGHFQIELRHALFRWQFTTKVWD